MGYKTPKNTLVPIFIKIGPVNQKLPEGVNYQHFNIIIRYKPPKNTLLQIFIKIGPVNQKLPKGG